MTKTHQREDKQDDEVGDDLAMERQILRTLKAVIKSLGFTLNRRGIHCVVWAKEFIPSKWSFGSLLLASELKVAKLDVETSQKTSSTIEERNDTTWNREL